MSKYDVVIETVMGSTLGLSDDIEVDVELIVESESDPTRGTVRFVTDATVKNVVTFNNASPADLTPRHRERAIEIACERV